MWESFRFSARDRRRLLEYFVLGVPAYRLRFRGPVSRPTAERFFRCIREVLSTDQGCTEPLCGTIECDETTFGGKRSGKRGWGAAGKILVFGILQRNGIVQVFPVPKRSAHVVRGLLRHYTKPGSLYYTDDWHAYATLGLRGNHVVVRKDKGQPKGRDHINGIEGFWSYAKHWLYHYRGVPQKFFHVYLGEISFRFNHRNEDLYPLILKLLQTTTNDKNSRKSVRLS